MDDLARNRVIETWRIGELRPYERNARRHTPEQIEQIAASIRQWGWTMPILADESGMVLAGHGRLAAGKLLGMVEVPVIVARGWSEAQKRAYVLADNRLTDASDWDDELLRLEMSDLRGLDFDLSLTGFDDREVDELLAVRFDPVIDPEDAPPPPPSDPVTRAGDLWQLGDHRVLCGDCRDPAAVARLVGDRVINLAFTSPPYAEQRDYDHASGFKPIHPDQYVEWFAPVAANVAAHLAGDGSWFVNIKPAAEGLDTHLYVFDLVIAHVRRWGWHFATELCWERPGVPKSVTRRFKNQFEPIYHFARSDWKMRPDAVRHESENVPRAGGPGSGETSWRNKQGGVGANSVSGSFGAVKKRRNGSRDNQAKLQGSRLADGSSGNQPGEYVGPGLAYPGNRLPTFSRTHEALGHAAAFPIGLPQFFCAAYSDAGDVIFDPFLGSGSTLMAAEISNRIGLGCELSPGYCDVAIDRWQSYTGRIALLADTGETFAEISARRKRNAAA